MRPPKKKPTPPRKAELILMPFRPKAGETPQQQLKRLANVLVTFGRVVRQLAAELDTEGRR